MMEELRPNDLRQTLSRGVQDTLSHLKAVGTRAIRWWQTLEPQYKKLLLGLGASVVLLVVILAVWKIPQRQLAPLKAKIQRERGTLRPPERLKLEHDARKLEHDVRTAMVQALGGVLVVIGLIFTAKTWLTTREGQITDRFTKAINQLGEAAPAKLAIRLGGIYALERIARDSKRDHWPIMEVLTAYVRENAPWKEEEQGSQKEDTPPNESPPPMTPGARPKPAADIQAILMVLQRRRQSFENGEPQGLDLRHTDLRGANLDSTNLEEADLEGAQLQGANLSFAQLQGANLRNAYLQMAVLRNADLQEAVLRDAWLQEANLLGAHHLTVDQLFAVKTLYQACIEQSLLAGIRRSFASSRLFAYPRPRAARPK